MHNNYVKIGIRDNDGDIETPWALPLGNNRYRLDNIPFFAYRISCGDIIEALPESDGFLFFTRVVQKSGHRTMRVMLPESPDIEPGPTLLASIRRLGCSYSGAFEKLICIDIPPTVALDAVANRLIEMEVEWEYADPTYEDLFSNQEKKPG